MWYAVISQDNADSLPLRKVHRPAHLDRLKALNQAGRLLIAGPHPAIDSSDPGDLILILLLPPNHGQIKTLIY